MDKSTATESKFLLKCSEPVLRLDGTYEFSQNNEKATLGSVLLGILLNRKNIDNSFANEEETNMQNSIIDKMNLNEVASMFTIRDFEILESERAFLRECVNKRVNDSFLHKQLMDIL